MRMPRTLGLVLAGGQGSRLGALTDDRAKPVLPVGGTYRLIDIALSNLAHSHISDVWVIQQYLPHSLNEHLANGRPWDLDRTHGGLRVLPPFEGADGAGFARGNTDALNRQKQLIREFDPDLVLMLSADHLYTLDFLDLLETHRDRGADLTMATTPVDEDASRYAVVSTDDEGTVTGFDYKPQDPPGNLVAMEVFLFDTASLLTALDELEASGADLADYGEDLLPWFVEHRRVAEHRHDGYWMDLGTLQSYWTAHLQLLDGTGAELDDPDRPILTAQPQLLPARIHSSARIAESMVAAGAEVRGNVTHSVVGPRTVIDEGATVRHSVLLDGVHVGPGVILENVVADAGADISGGNRRGTEGAVTLIGADGLVSTTEDFDRTATLPDGF
ncbi:glucose-1-phosphate adenylyltransferase family protein [Arthrobacter sp. JSM 101049]|uniref:glucose-1-phosphate adenylyltransferase family protein n=1 Tax=Arthrobacter sp. JSM 101049 TaxID=929097 RepID=UPI00356ADC82